MPRTVAPTAPAAEEPPAKKKQRRARKRADHEGTIYYDAKA